MHLTTQHIHACNVSRSYGTTALHIGAVSGVHCNALQYPLLLRVGRPCLVVDHAMHTDTGASRTSWQQPLTEQALARGLQPLAPAVALGKFDALHQVIAQHSRAAPRLHTISLQGHQALARACSTQGMQPWMVSFSGMAQVLGWPQRLPLIAPQQRCVGAVAPQHGVCAQLHISVMSTGLQYWLPGPPSVVARLLKSCTFRLQTSGRFPQPHLSTSWPPHCVCNALWLGKTIALASRQLGTPTYCGRNVLVMVLRCVR